MSVKGVSSFFRAEPAPNNSGIVINVSSGLVNLVQKAAPYVAVILAGSTAPFWFAVGGGCGFFLASPLAYYNKKIDDLFKAHDLGVKILLTVAAFVAIFLSPTLALLSAVYAGQRTGCWIQGQMAKAR